jgi:hypothetical protein
MLIFSVQRWLILYILLAVLLFSCFGLMASTMLRMLGKEIEFIQENGHSKLNCPVDVLISKWSRHYFMTIDFVHQCNRCFGCLLLVLIAPAFIRVINTSFQLMINFKDGQWTMDMILQLMILLVHFVLFTLIANIPHKIRQEVIYTNFKLPLKYTAITDSSILQFLDF